MHRWTSGVAHLYTQVLDGQQPAWIERIDPGWIWLLELNQSSNLYLSDVTSGSHWAHATFVSAATEQWGLKGGPVRPKHVSHVRRRSVDEYLLLSFFPVRSVWQPVEWVVCEQLHVQPQPQQPEQPLPARSVTGRVSVRLREDGVMMEVTIFVC